MVGQMLPRAVRESPRIATATVVSPIYELTLARVEKQRPDIWALSISLILLVFLPTSVSL